MSAAVNRCKGEGNGTLDIGCRGCGVVVLVGKASSKEMRNQLGKRSLCRVGEGFLLRDGNGFYYFRLRFV
jgi:hypothetical protein